MTPLDLQATVRYSPHIVNALCAEAIIFARDNYFRVHELFQFRRADCFGGERMHIATHDAALHSAGQSIRAIREVDQTFVIWHVRSQGPFLVTLKPLWKRGHQCEAFIP